MNKFDDKDLKILQKVLNTEFKAKKSKLFVNEFEKKFSDKFNCKYGISCCNGTATLHGILMGMGIKEGDEVITTPLTMSATSLCILHANAQPVFADVDKDTFLIDPQSIKKKITPKTKAIITVSLYGLSPEMDEIMEIANKNNLYVIEDNAQCFLGYYKGKLLGSIGHASSYSFQNTKHMTTGEGGMILTNDIELQDKICKATILGYQTVGELAPKFSNSEFRDPSFKRHIAFGYNYRMSELCCALGITQLNKLDFYVSKRIEIANKFHDILTETNCDWLLPQKVNHYIKHVYWGFSVRINRDDISFIQFRDKFMEYGGKAPYAAWELTYLEPLFENKKITDYQWQEFKRGLCPNAEYLQSRIISFQNNYIDNHVINIQIDALKNTINFFNKKKIVAIIYCRLNSTRLPNKGMLKLNNIESISRVILNTQKMNVDKIVIATGYCEKNYLLKNVANKYDIDLIFGSENNLLNRTLHVINKYNLTDRDYIVRVTGDDVLRSYEIANILIGETIKDYDYITNFPDDCATGLGTEILSVKSIRKLSSIIEEDNEHLTYYYLCFKKLFIFKIVKLNNYYKLGSNLTLDNIEDYKKLDIFFRENSINNSSVDFKTVKEYFKNNLEQKRVCIGSNQDETLKELNNINMKYENFTYCNDLDDEIKKLFS